MSRLTIKTITEFSHYIKTRAWSSLERYAAFSDGSFHYLYTCLSDAESIVSTSLVTNFCVRNSLGLEQSNMGFLRVPKITKPDTSPYLVWMDELIGRSYMPEELKEAILAREKQEQMEVENSEEIAQLKKWLAKKEKKRKPVEIKLRSLDDEITTLKRALSSLHGGCPLCGNAHWPHCKED